jgi:hypothetical protein
VRSIERNEIHWNQIKKCIHVSDGIAQEIQCFLAHGDRRWLDAQSQEVWNTPAIILNGRIRVNRIIMIVVIVIAIVIGRLLRSIQDTQPTTNTRNGMFPNSGQLTP